MKQHLLLKKKPSNILIISMRYLGDVLLTTPLIKTIKNAYPDSDVDILVYSNTATMLEGNTDINEIITTPPHPKASDYKYLLKKIFRHYDLSIVTQSGDRRFIYGLLSAPTCISVTPPKKEKGWWKRFFLQGWVEADLNKNHTVIEFLKLSDMLGIPSKLDLTPPKSAAFTNPDQFTITDHYAVMHVHPQWKYKRWHNQGWLDIGYHLKKKGLKIILSGGPSEEEKNYIETIYQKMPLGTVNLAGKVSLADLAHIISNAKLFIGPDTGITHLAAATGIPLIALYGPTNPIKWAPWPFDYKKKQNPFDLKDSQHINNIYLIQGQGDCVPCFQEGCDKHRQSHSNCLNTLPSKTIIDTIDLIL